MPTININRKVFEKLVGKKLPLEKLKDRISYLGTDLEEITKDEIIVEVFPNRPDMLSEQGFARAFSSFIGIKTGLRTYKVNKSNHKMIIDSSVKTVRPFTACCIIKNLNFNEEKIREIIQIQEKLHLTYGRKRKKVAIGIYPSEKIKYPITFKALPPEKIKFQPLEYPIELTGKQILEKHPKGKEYAHLLEGKTKYPLFVDANNQVLSMPPIINSENVGKITEKTKDVFIEVSGFDFKACKICLNILATTLADMGGKIYSMEINFGNKKETTPNLNPSKMKLNLDYINKRLGLNLKEKEAKKLLERMGYKYLNKTVLIPAYRADILHQVDLAEDIAIAYGYENFNEEIPNISTIGQEDPFEIFKRKISNLLVGLNLLEVSTYHILSEENHNQKMNYDADVITLDNPASTEYSVLRSWIVPSLMKILSENTHNEYPQNIFEISEVFIHNKKTETNVEEATRLAVVLCDKDANFTRIKQVFDALMRSLKLSYKIEETKHPSFIPGRVARISIKGKKVAYIGEVHPEVISNFDIKMPVACFELNLSDLFKFI